MNLLIEKVESFRKAPKINVILGGKKDESVWFEALGFDFEVNDDNKLNIICYDAYEESEDWGGGFLYGYTLAEAKVEISKELKELFRDGKEVFKKLKNNAQFNEEFSKLNVNKKPFIEDDVFIFAITEEIEQNGKDIYLNIDEMFNLVVKYLLK